MKRIVTLAAVMALVAPSLALAKGGNHPMAGCGLGYVLFGHNDNSPVMQVLAATTNSISGNATFGMTTGTSGCTDDGAVKFVKEAEVYAEVNFDSLRKEMAEGQGEYVRTFASLLGATDSNVDSLVQVFQSNYTTLFSSSETDSAQLLASLQTLLDSHKELVI